MTYENVQECELCKKKNIKTKIYYIYNPYIAIDCAFELCKECSKQPKEKILEIY